MNASTMSINDHIEFLSNKQIDIGPCSGYIVELEFEIGHRGVGDKFLTKIAIMFNNSIIKEFRINELKIKEKTLYNDINLWIFD